MISDRWTPLLLFRPWSSSAISVDETGQHPPAHYVQRLCDLSALESREPPQKCALKDRPEMTQQKMIRYERQAHAFMIYEYFWYIMIYLIYDDIWWYLYIYIGDDSLYGFWMGLNPNSVECRPWSQTISRLSSAHFPEDDQWQSESYFPYGLSTSMNQPHFLPCLMSLMLHSALHPQAQKIKKGRPIVKSTSTLVQYPLTWQTSRLGDDLISLIYPSKKTSKNRRVDAHRFSAPGTCRFVPPRNLSGGFLEHGHDCHGRGQMA